MKNLCIIIIIIIVLLVSLFRPVYRDWAFVCENTRSHKAYRQWFFGLRTGESYKKSTLEEFIQKNYPDLLEHRWTSVKGTGKNIIGIPILYGHGRPGPITKIPPEVFDEWIQESEPKEVLQLYILLSSNETKEAKYQRIEEIFEEWENR